MDQFTGATHLAYTDVALPPVDGYALQVVRSYSNKIYSTVNLVASPGAASQMFCHVALAPIGWLGQGWDLHYGRLRSVQPAPGESPYWLLELPGGRAERFYPDTLYTETETDVHGNPIPTWRSQNFWRLKPICIQDCGTFTQQVEWEATAPGGTVYRFEALARPNILAGAFHVQRITTLHGYEVTVTYGQSEVYDSTVATNVLRFESVPIAEVRDSLGRVIRFVTKPVNPDGNVKIGNNCLEIIGGAEKCVSVGSSTPPGCEFCNQELIEVLDRIEVRGPHGNWVQYRYDVDRPRIASTFQFGFLELNGVTTPVGYETRYTYDEFSTNVMQQLVRMTLPTGATVEYAHQARPFFYGLYAQYECGNVTVDKTIRGSDVPTAPYDYAYSDYQSALDPVVTTDPSGARTKSYFYAYAPDCAGCTLEQWQVGLLRMLEVEDAQGSLVRREEYTYQPLVYSSTSDTSPPINQFEPAQTAVLAEKRVTLFGDQEPDRQFRVIFGDYDQYGNPGFQEEYGFDGSRLRRTEFDYAWSEVIPPRRGSTADPVPKYPDFEGGNLIHQMAQVRVYDAAAGLVSETVTEYYDADTFTSGGSGGARGEVRSTRRQRLRSEDGIDHKVEFAYRGDPRTAGTWGIFRWDAFAAVAVTEFAYRYGALEKVAPSPSRAILTRGIQPDTGAILWQEDANGHRTTFTYDAAGRLTRITDPDQVSTTITYPSVTQATVTRRENFARYTYDSLGRLTESSTLLDAAANQFAHVRTRYDARGLLQRQTEATGRTGTLTPATTYEYDALQRVRRITTPDGVTAYTYDANVVTVTDPAQHTARLEYDALGRLAAVTDALNQTTRYEYNAQDRLTRVIPPPGTLGQRTLIYNTHGELVTETQPETGTISYRYDGNGNPTRKILPDGQEVTYSYDHRNRLTRIVYPDKPATQFFYDGEDFPISGTWHENPYDHLTFLVDEAGTTAWDYDALGRVTRKTVTRDGYAFTVAYRYSPEGARTQLTYPSGLTDVGVSPNAGDLPEAVRRNGQPLWSGATFTSAGGFREIPFANGMTTRITPDDRNRPEQIIAFGWNGTFALDYTYTARGAVDTLTANGRSDQFTYDPLQRLTRVEYGDGATITYAFDAYGNLTGRTASFSGLGLSRAYANNRATDLGYDGRGNVVSDGAHQYAFTSDDRLCEADGRLAFRYNGRGLRARTEDTQTQVLTYFLYDEAGNLLSEFQRLPGEPPTPTNDYVYGNGQLLVTVNHTSVDAEVPCPQVAESPDATQVTLRWLPRPGCQSYRVYRREAESDPWVLRATGLTATTYVDAVVPCREYFYAVTAVDTAGQESPQEGTCRFVAAPGAPAAPTLLQAVDLEAGGSLQATWAPSPTCDVQAYVVTAEHVATGATTTIAVPWDPAAEGAGQYTATFTGLRDCEAYRITVQARDYGGALGPVSNAMTATPSPPALLAPEEITLDPTGAAGSIEVAWFPPSASDQACDFVGFHLYRSDDGGPFVQVNGLITDPTPPGQRRGPISYTDTGLAPCVRYTYRVTAVDAQGNESVVNPEAATYLPVPGAPAPPTGVGVEDPEEGGVLRVRWTAAPTCNVLRYRIQVRVPGGSWQAVFVDRDPAADAAGYVTLIGDEPGCRRGGCLTPCQDYQVRVAAVDVEARASANTSPVTGRPTPPGPSAPTNLRAQIEEAGTQVVGELTWRQPPECDVAGYRVFRRVVGETTWTLLTPTPVTGTAYTDATLAPCVSYAYTVEAVDEYGNTGPLALEEPLADQRNLNAPPAPIGPPWLQVHKQGADAVLDWPAAQDSQNCPVTGYRIYRHADPAVVRTLAAPHAAPTGTTFTDPGVLTDGVPLWCYVVKPVDTQGNEAGAADTVALDPPVAVAATGTTVLKFGDVTGDTALDLLVGDPAGGLRLLVNDGQGTLTDAGLILTGGQVTALAVEDFNNDGALDVAAEVVPPGDVALLFGNGRGGFTAGDPLAADVLRALAAGDLDGDGVPDLVGGGAHGLTWWRNAGGGALVAQEEWEWPGPVFALALLDIDSDGHLDLLAGSSGVVRVARNDGSGNLERVQTIAFGNAPITALEPGDLNQDGYPDLVVADAAGQADVYFNWPLPGAGDEDDDGEADDDENGDAGEDDDDDGDAGEDDDDADQGEDDAGDQGGTHRAPPAAGRALRPAATPAAAFTRRFVRTPQDLVFGPVQAIRLGDLTNDGSLDLVALTSDPSPDLWVNGGNGWLFPSPDRVGVQDAMAAVVGDLDRDADLDVVVSAASSGVTRHVNRAATHHPNAPPQPPTELWAKQTGEWVTFYWETALDAETRRWGQTYTLRVSHRPGGDEICQVQLGPEQTTVIAGFLWHATAKTLRLPPGCAQVYWSVQAVDGGYAGSAWAPEQMLELETPVGASGGGGLPEPPGPGSFLLLKTAPTLSPSPGGGGSQGEGGAATLASPQPYTWQIRPAWEERPADPQGTAHLRRGRPIEDVVDPAAFTAAIYYHVNDHLGTTRLLVDEAGELAGTYEYGPFGEDIGRVDCKVFSQGYTGHVEASGADVGLVYMKGRYYSPTQGRFVSTDPVVRGKTGSPGSFNLYVYTSNDPLNFVDPDGHERLLHGVRIIERKDWRAKPPLEALDTRGTDWNRITVHHTADQLPLAGVDWVRREQEIHQNEGFKDIAYHFLIDKEGNIYEGTPLEFRGQHVKVGGDAFTPNVDNIGIVLLGHFDKEIVAGNQLYALAELVGALKVEFTISSPIKGHFQYKPTACPGANCKRLLAWVEGFSEEWAARLLRVRFGPVVGWAYGMEHQ